MKTLTEKLAGALRSACDGLATSDYQCDILEAEEGRALLAEYDNASRAPVFDPEGFTQTPWRASRSGSSTIIAGDINGTVIAETTGYMLPRLANARRIIACVNACAGLSTAEIEARGVVINPRA